MRGKPEQQLAVLTSLSTEDLIPVLVGRTHRNKSTTTARFTSSPSRPMIPSRFVCRPRQPDLVGPA
jgi:hypothetical protein